MSPPDHYELSLRCRRKAEQEIEQNDLLTAAEMMWGAVVHAIKFVAPTDIRDTLHSHRDIKQALPAIDARIPVVNLQRLFGHGEALHRYFYPCPLTRTPGQEQLPPVPAVAGNAAGLTQEEGTRCRYRNLASWNG
jgi:hypothetical protein